jgi:hypothetical protein
VLDIVSIRVKPLSGGVDWTVTWMTSGPMATA